MLFNKHFPALLRLIPGKTSYIRHDFMLPPILPILPGGHIYPGRGTYIAAGGDGMYIENTYPSHTTKEEWDELALLATKLLSAMAIPLQKQNAHITIAV
jgi:hypothetical protein